MWLPVWQHRPTSSMRLRQQRLPLLLFPLPQQHSDQRLPHLQQPHHLPRRLHRRLQHLRQRP